MGLRCLRVWFRREGALGGGRGSWWVVVLEARVGGFGFCECEGRKTLEVTVVMGYETGLSQGIECDAKSKCAAITEQRSCGDGVGSYLREWTWVVQDVD